MRTIPANAAEICCKTLKLFQSWPVEHCQSLGESRLYTVQLVCSSVVCVCVCVCVAGEDGG